MKSKYFIFITSALIALCSCSTKESKNSVNSTMSGFSSLSEDYLVSTIPQKITYSGLEYVMADNENEIIEIVLDTIIAYLINLDDFDKFYNENPNIDYYVDETNSVYNVYGENKFPVYSIKNQSVSDYIAVKVNDGSPILFIKN